MAAVVGATAAAAYVDRARQAMLREDWPTALALWNEALSRCRNGGNPYWQASRLRVLLELDRLDEAVPEFGRLCRDYSHLQAGFVGLAQVATRQRRWPEALAAWEDLLERFPASADTPVWIAARAGVLVELGATGEAEESLRTLAMRGNRPLNALLGLLRVLILTDRPEQALRELDLSEYGALDLPVLVERRLDILVRLKRLEDARKELEQVLQRSDSHAVLESLFNFTPALYEGWERTRIWLALLKRLDKLVAEAADDAGPGVGSLRPRLLLAFRDYQSFGQIISGDTDLTSLGRYRDGLAAVARIVRESPFPDYDRPKVFGIGLSKTGTTSLAQALRLLGFQVLDWLNPLTRELMCEDDLHLFDAFTDTPAATGFERHYHLFPNSLFIYTVRPLDSWKQSIMQHWRRHYGVADFGQARQELRLSDRFHYGRQFRNLHHSLYFNHAGFEQAWLAHDVRVRNFFHDKPPGRLLEFNVFAGDGWVRLCKFLGRPVPATPFPWENRRP